MLKLRRLLTITKGVATKDSWLEAAAQEAPVTGDPKMCARCPIRKSGPWRDGVSAAVAEMDEDEQEMMAARWGCHADARPCAGMHQVIGLPQ